ncbi:MAG: SAV_915 family protein [Streptomycetales bacterium]
MNGPGDQDQSVLPPMVYVPSRRVQSGDEQAQLELRTLDDGRLAVLAFSSLDRLTAGCGPDQPWVLLRSEVLAGLQPGVGFDVVLVDVPLPPDLRHGGERGGAHGVEQRGANGEESGDG